MSQGMTIDGPGDTVSELLREIASCENGKTLCVQGPDILPLVLIGPGRDQACLDAQFIREVLCLLLRKLKEPHLSQLGDIVASRAILPEQTIGTAGRNQFRCGIETSDYLSTPFRDVRVGIYAKELEHGLYGVGDEERRRGKTKAEGWTLFH